MAARPSRTETSATHRALHHVNSDVGAFLNIVGVGLALFNANVRKRFSLFCSRNAWSATSVLWRSCGVTKITAENVGNRGSRILL